MSTAQIRASQMPQVWPFLAFARVAAVIGTVMEVYSEALRQTHELQKYGPFTDE